MTIAKQLEEASRHLHVLAAIAATIEQPTLLPEINATRAAFLTSELHLTVELLVASARWFMESGLIPPQAEAARKEAHQ